MNTTIKVTHSNHLDMAKNFLFKLEKMNCPFVENVDERWILQLLLTPGEARLRILHFLVLQFNPDLKQIFEVKFPLNNELNFRIKNMLSVLSMLGFCATEDVNLIKGETRPEDQYTFLSSLIDAAYDTTQSIANSIVGGNTTFNPDISYRTNPRTDFTPKSLANYEFMIDLCTDPLTLQQLMCTRVTSIPDDLYSQILRSAPSTHPKSAKTCRETVEKIPKICELLRILEIAERELLHEQEMLDDLQPSEDAVATVTGRVNNYKREEMRVVLVELEQLFTSFRYTFDTELSSWCHQRINVNTQEMFLHGNQMKQIDELWSHFDRYMKGLTEVKQSIEHIKDRDHVVLSDFSSKQGDIIKDGVMTIKNITAMLSLMQ